MALFRGAGFNYPNGGVLEGRPISGLVELGIPMQGAPSNPIPRSDLFRYRKIRLLLKAKPPSNDKEEPPRPKPDT